MSPLAAELQTLAFYGLAVLMLLGAGWVAGRVLTGEGC